MLYIIKMVNKKINLNISADCKKLKKKLKDGNLPEELSDLSNKIVENCSNMQKKLNDISETITDIQSISQKGGGKSKKVRKHIGIHQTGGNTLVSPTLDKIWEDLFSSIGIYKTEKEKSITSAQFRINANNYNDKYDTLGKNERFHSLGVEAFGDNYETTLNQLYANSFKKNTGKNFPLRWKKGGNKSPNDFNVLSLQEKESIFINFTSERGATNTVLHYWLLYCTIVKEERKIAHQAINNSNIQSDITEDAVGIVKSYIGGKKIRRHRGIHQTGGKVGKLKKGYKYSGKKLKNGLPQIVKAKSKKNKKQTGGKGLHPPPLPPYPYPPHPHPYPYPYPYPYPVMEKKTEVNK